jgi:hypothetical protein
MSENKNNKKKCLKVKITRKGIKVHSLAHNSFKGRGCDKAPGWGLG